MLGPPPLPAAAGVSRTPTAVPGWRSRIALTRNAPTLNSPPPGSPCPPPPCAVSAPTGTRNARAGGEDHHLAPGTLDGDARRVAAVARRVRSGSGDRAPRPPERHRVGHVLRQRDSLALSYGKIWR